MVVVGLELEQVALARLVVVVLCDLGGDVRGGVHGAFYDSRGAFQIFYAS